MDFDLMITSFPKLLNATLITLKLLSISLIVGMLLGLFFAILRMNKNVFINPSGIRLRVRNWPGGVF